MNKIIFLLFGLCLGIVGNAQEYSLYQMREVWNANYLNPGFFPRHQLVVSLPSVHSSFNTAGIGNSGLLRYDASAGAFTLNGDIQAGDIDQHWTARNNLNLDAIAVGVRAGRAFVSLSTQTVVESRIRLPETFMRTVVEGTADYLNTPLDLGPSLDIMAYQKASLGFSYAVSPRLSLGGRVNRLLGLASFQTVRSGLALTQSDDIYQTTVALDYHVNYYGAGQLNPVDLSSQGFEDFEDETTGEEFEAKGGNVFNVFRQINQQNNGWSADLGAEYLLNDRLTLSAALLNFGRINWKNGTQQVKVNGEVTFEGVDVVRLEEDEDYEPVPDLDTIGTFEAVSGVAYQQALSPRTYIAANYRLTRNIELGGLLFNELGREGGFTAFSLSSRFSLGRILGLGAAYNLQHRATNSLGANISLNLGPLQIYGIAEDVSSLFGVSNIDGLNFRAGLNLVFGRKQSEQKLAASRMGDDPFPANGRPFTLPADPLAETEGGDGPVNRPTPTNQSAADDLPGRKLPAESDALSVYTLKLDLLDEEKQKALDVVFLDLYKIDEDGHQTLLRTGRYPQGKIVAMLETSQDWHIAKISAYQYDTLEVRFQADPEEPLPQNWYMVRQPLEDMGKVELETTEEMESPAADASDAAPAEPDAKMKADSSASADKPTPQPQPSEPAPAPQPKAQPPLTEQPERTPESAQQTNPPRPVASNYILTKRTSLREAPDSQSRVISRMPVGTELLLLERTNEWWWRVSMGGWKGYVKAHLLKNKD